MLIDGLWIMLGAYAAGAIVSLPGRLSSRATRLSGHVALLIGALTGVFLALPCMANGVPPPALQAALPPCFAFANMVIVVDGLSAFFLLVVSAVAIAAAIYGPAYLDSHSTASPAVEGVGINLFVGCMALVLCAGDALTFLLAWEGMTLASYALVVSEAARRTRTPDSSISSWPTPAPRS